MFGKTFVFSLVGLILAHPAWSGEGIFVLSAAQWHHISATEHVRTLTPVADAIQHLATMNNGQIHIVHPSAPSARKAAQELHDSFIALGIASRYLRIQPNPQLQDDIELHVIRTSASVDTDKNKVGSTTTSTYIRKVKVP